MAKLADDTPVELQRRRGAGRPGQMSQRGGVPERSGKEDPRQEVERDKRRKSGEAYEIADPVHRQSPFHRRKAGGPRQPHTVDSTRYCGGQTLRPYILWYASDFPAQTGWYRVQSQPPDRRRSGATSAQTCDGPRLIKAPGAIHNPRRRRRLGGNAVNVPSRQYCAR